MGSIVGGGPLGRARDAGAAGAPRAAILTRMSTPGERPPDARRAPTAVALVLVLAAAVLARVAVAGHESPDYRVFLSHWWGHLATHGFAGLGDVFADYAPPYLYLLWLATLTGAPPLLGIKAVSAIGDVALALAVAGLVRHVAGRRAGAVAGVALLAVPTTWLNSAAWGQCDAIYTSLVVAAAWALLARRDLLGWVLLGAALAVKLQAVLVAPAVAVVWLLRWRRCWWMPVVVPVVVLASWVPCLLAGRSLASLVDTYRGQATSRFPLSYAPNLWYPVQDARGVAAVAGWSGVALLTTAAVVGVVLVAAVARRAPWTDERLLALLAFAALAAPTLLPHMRERYMYPGQVLTFALAAAVGGRSWWMPVTLYAVSALAYAQQLAPRRLAEVAPWLPNPLVVGAPVVCLVVLALAVRVVRPARG